MGREVEALYIQWDTQGTWGGKWRHYIYSGIHRVHGEGSGGIIYTVGYTGYMGREVEALYIQWDTQGTWGGKWRHYIYSGIHRVHEEGSGGIIYTVGYTGYMGYPTVYIMPPLPSPCTLCIP